MIYPQMSQIIKKPFVFVYFKPSALICVICGLALHAFLPFIIGNSVLDIGHSSFDPAFYFIIGHSVLDIHLKTNTARAEYPGRALYYIT
jgi:hypothetical protein